MKRDVKKSGEKKNAGATLAADEWRTLAASAVFDGFSMEEAQRLAGEMGLKVLSFGDGEVVADESDAAMRMGVVLSGHLHVYDSAFKGVRHLVRIVRAGGVIGASLISERMKAYPALVTAFGECRIAAFPLSTVRKLQKYGGGRLFDNIAHLASETLQECWRTNAILSCAKIDDRVMLYLRDRSRRERSKTISIGSTEAEFADFLGVSREALVRSLRKLSAAGCLSYRRDEFTLS